MTQLLDLADELLVFIFRHLRGCSTLNDSWQTLTTCKRLYEVGRSVLIEHIKVKDKSFDSFIWTCKANRWLFANTQSLTIDISMTWPQIAHHPASDRVYQRYVELAGWREFHDVDDQPCSHDCLKSLTVLGRGETTFPNKVKEQLQRLTSTIEANLPKLESLCLMIDGEPQDQRWCRCSKSLVNAKIIGRLLEALPQSCTSIYLDTGGTDFSGNGQTRWIGDALAKRCSILESLWIRASTDIKSCFFPELALENKIAQSAGIVAFQKWCTNNVGSIEHRRNAEDVWDLADERMERFKMWMQHSIESREAMVAEVEKTITDDLGNFDPQRLPNWPRLRSLSIDQCFYPIKPSKDRDGEAGAFANALTRHQCLFPVLEKGIVVESQLDEIDDQELGFLNRLGEGNEWSNPPWYPVSTLIVWDIVGARTDVLPLMLVKREVDFPRAGIGSEPLHLLRNRHGMVTHGSYHALMRIVHESYGLGWMLSNADSMMLPAYHFREVEQYKTQAQTEAETITNLAKNGYGMDMYVRAWLAQNISLPEMLDRVEAYWARDHQPTNISGAELKRLLSLYDAASESNKQTKISSLHSWVQLRYISLLD